MTSFGIKPKSSGKNDPRNIKQIRFHIFEEAYQRDLDANKLKISDNNILLTEIQKKYPISGNIEEYRREARGMDMRDDPLIEFVGNVNEDTIRITDRGRNYWEENPNRDISESDL